LRELNEFLLECPSATSLKKGVSAVPPKKQTFIAKLQSLPLLQKTTFACVRVGCLTVKGLPDTALVADMAAIVANLRFNGLMASFFFSGHEKSVKGRFEARNFDPNCFGVVKIHASSANKLSLRLPVERLGISSISGKPCAMPEARHAQEPTNSVSPHGNQIFVVRLPMKST